MNERRAESREIDLLSSIADILSIESRHSVDGKDDSIGGRQELRERASAETRVSRGVDEVERPREGCGRFLSGRQS